MEKLFLTPYLMVKKPQYFPHSWEEQECPFSVCLPNTCSVQESAEGKTEKGDAGGETETERERNFKGSYWA